MEVVGFPVSGDSLCLLVCLSGNPAGISSSWAGRLAAIWEDEKAAYWGYGW